MQKILVLTSTFPRWSGDSEPPFVFELCKQLSNDFKVYVLAPHSEGALDHEIMANINVVRFHYFFKRFETLCYEGGILARIRTQPLRILLIPFFITFQLIKAYRLIAIENISIIHAHWIIPQGLVACLLRHIIQRPLAILCTSHGGDIFSLKGKVFQFLKRKIILNVQAVSVVNSVMADEIRSLCQPYVPKVSVIPMGADFQNTFVRSKTESKPYSLLFVGRLVEKKGVSYLIGALPKILHHFPEVRLTIIGTGPEYPILSQQVNELKLQNHVVFLGAVPNNKLPIYYQRNQVAIFPFIVAENGDREGLPVVVSEAIGCGCCVVTTCLPGINDLITHEHNGLLVEQKNSESIASAIVSLYSDQKKIKQYSSTAFNEITTKQDLTVIGKSYSRLIQSLHPM